MLVRLLDSPNQTYRASEDTIASMVLTLPPPRLALGILGWVTSARLVVIAQGALRHRHHRQLATTLHLLVRPPSCHFSS